MHYVEALINQLSKFTEIPDLMSLLSDFDLTALRSVLPELTKLINSGNTLDGIVDR